MSISESLLYEKLNNYREIWNVLIPQINQNIDKNRKGKATIRVVDEKGDFINNAKIVIKQKTHSFQFGCNGLMLKQFETDKENEMYENLFTNLFNTVTTTLCLSVYSPEKDIYTFEKGEWRRPSPYTVIDFAKKNNLCLKGQPLLADSWYPQWASKSSADAKSLYINYFKEINKRFSESFDIFDMVNEAFLCKERTPDFPLYNEDLDYVDWAFLQGEKIFPNSVNLELNEHTAVNTGEAAKHYLEIVKRLISNNIRLDSIGFQFHMFTTQSGIEHIEGSNLNPNEILKTYIEFCEINKPLYISEVTVPSNFGVDREFGEKIQAEIIENLYRLWFSIPNMNGIIYWNLKDGPAWKTEGDCLGCLVNSEMDEKMSYKTLDRLINKEWKTNVETTISEEFSFSGFYGNYELLITTSDGTTKVSEFELTKNQDNIIKIVV